MRVYPLGVAGVNEMAALDGDATILMNGRKIISGLARYCQHTTSRSKANVIVVPAEDCKWTWGIRVKHDRTIQKGDEIFLDWNQQYPITRKCSL
jgi:hypothetical protein